MLGTQDLKKLKKWCVEKALRVFIHESEAGERDEISICDTKKSPSQGTGKGERVLSSAHEKENPRNDKSGLGRKEVGVRR